MSALLVIGAGGHGRVVADAALTTGAWTTVCFVDDRAEVGDSLGLNVVGTFADLERLVTKYQSVAIGLGEAQLRLQLIDRCGEIGFELPIVVHRSAAVSRFASIGAGSVLFANTAVNPGVILERGCIVNSGATVDHDCSLGEGVHVCPGAHLAGNVRVGARTWIGIGSCVKQGISLGSDVIVGAGAAVVDDVESGMTVVGVPARPRQRRS